MCQELSSTMLKIILDKCFRICYNMPMIKVYNNYMSIDDMTTLYTHAVTANYEIGWDDTSTIENRQYPCLHHDVSRADLGEFMHYFYDTPELKNYNYEKSVINLVTPSSVNFRHTHGDDTRVVCYYINPEWREEWYGETIFYKDNGEDDRVISYLPNKAVIFDGTHPHSIRPASFIAPSYRFTLSVFFKLQDKNSS